MATFYTINYIIHVTFLCTAIEVREEPVELYLYIHCESVHYLGRKNKIILH